MNDQENARQRYIFNAAGYIWFVMIVATVALLMLAVLLPGVGILKYLFLGSGIAVVAAALIMLVAFSISSGVEQAKRERSGEGGLWTGTSVREEETPRWMSWTAAVILSMFANIKILIHQELYAGNVYLMFALRVLLGVLPILLFATVIPAAIKRFVSGRLYEKVRSAGSTAGYIVFFVVLLWMAKGTEGIRSSATKTGLVHGAASIAVYIAGFAFVFALMCGIAYVSRKVALSRDRERS